jgi:crotonobetainyl-CoA:carnitine CoA-transferase CaiB-like acyl-CoA transferase
MIERILSGLTVIDLTQNVAGPFCTQILGDMGATVIKVERPGRGDDTRVWRPPAVGGQSPTFLSLNRNKSSVCVDVGSEEGRQIVRNLAASADILVHSMKPGSAERRGLGFADLHALNPRLVYCAISAFGSIGPLSGLPGYDPLMQAFTGIMSTTGNEGDAPVRVGVSLIDMGTGLWGALGILAALLDRGRTGQGVNVEASLLETGITWMTIFVANFLASGELPRKLGSATVMTAPYELFKTKDGYAFIAAGNDRLFARVCEGLGAPALAADPRFKSNPDRVSNRPALHEALERLTVTTTTAQVVAAVQAAGAPSSELNDVSQMLEHEQVKAIDIIRPLPVPDGEDYRAIALPLTLGGSRGAPFRPPPALGADTDRVLRELGYEKGRLTSLREKGVIG